MIESSSIIPLSQESRRWWDCDDKAYGEWTHEDWAEIQQFRELFLEQTKCNFNSKQFGRVCQAGSSPVIKEACMYVHEREALHAI